MLATTSKILFAASKVYPFVLKQIEKKKYNNILDFINKFISRSFSDKIGKILDSSTHIYIKWDGFSSFWEILGVKS